MTRPSRAASQEDRDGQTRGVSTATVVIALVVAILLVPVVAYVGASAYVYDQGSRAGAKCPGDDVQDPTSFTVAGIDTTPYLLPVPQTVSFPARNDPQVTIAAWWEPVATLDAPTVILIHGLNGCRRNGPNLLAAGMLHRHGIAVLLIDMRNHGDSTVEDGRFSGGNDEYLDALGAFDWLRTQGIPAGRIGLLGFSLGAATAMIAIGEEPAVAAIWADSSYAEIREAIRNELTYKGFPTIFDVGAVLVGKIVTGEDIVARSPLEATAKLNGRPIFLTQGADDERIGPRPLAELAAGVRAAGGTVETWLVAAAKHTRALREHPAEYEQHMVDFFGRALGGLPAGS